MDRKKNRSAICDTKKNGLRRDVFRGWEVFVGVGKRGVLGRGWGGGCIVRDHINKNVDHHHLSNSDFSMKKSCNFTPVKANQYNM